MQQTTQEYTTHQNKKNLFDLYVKDSFTLTLAEKIKKEATKIHLKGLSGSLDAIILASLFDITKKHQLVILHNKEEAAYLQNDLQNFITPEKILLFPSSYKKPYDFEHIENANILMRSELLSKLNEKNHPPIIIVTYPEALTEKVINKRSLLQNTYNIQLNETLDINFITEFLNSYGFEKTDFVYEAGQFAIRGGIIDIFSFANELPYRIELFGDQIDSIRTFDPVSQLSNETLTEITIVPDIQTKLIQETRESFTNFLPQDTWVWFKDYEYTLDSIQKLFSEAERNFHSLLDESNHTKVSIEPKELFENAKSFQKNTESLINIAFGKRFTFQDAYEYIFDATPQPSFNKDFTLLIEHLHKNIDNGIHNFIATESLKQLQRLHAIFEELDPHVVFEELNLSIREGFIDKQKKIACYTDHQIFERFFRYKVKEKYSKSKALTLKELRTLNPGDYIVHVDYGVGRFAGLDKVEINNKHQEVLRIIYRDDDLLYLSIHALHKISKYSGRDGTPPTISKLGSSDWENKKKRTKKKVQEIAEELIELYAKRRASKGFAFSTDSFLQAELESSFFYEDTPDQAAATQDVKKDMEAPHPMDRLICGDVGFGKTEIAIRAAFKAVTDNKQVAILVPTTILAMQHYHTFSDRLKSFSVNIEYINRFRSTKQIKETLLRIKEGQTNILIGTHRITNKDVVFKDLRLLIIDEEQKFGVKVKDKLKELRVNVDTLTLTATPIPRTLHFSLMGARDLSIIATPPPNRQPVTTEIHTFREDVIRDAIHYEIQRGGQIFFVHNRIENIEEVGNIILKLIPDAKLAIAHGQMDGTKLEKIMLQFIEGEYDILLSTNIIESGLDIPNANTIIINQAHRFGLSDLHQMRGRVGRSNRKAFCYLLTPPSISLTNDARKRLSTLEEFSDLGDGFKVAMRDLDIRGAGNLLGAEQSGFISDLGFDMYHKILDEAIQELKESKFKDLFEADLKEAIQPLTQDCIIETDLEILIPEDYIKNITERLKLYTELDNIKNKEELSSFVESLKDRFGPLPETVKDLTKTVELRWLAEKLGLEKIKIKNEKLTCYFVSSEHEKYYQSEAFGKILKYIQKNPQTCKMKENKDKLRLYINNVTTIDDALFIFHEIIKSV